MVKRFSYYGMRGILMLYLTKTWLEHDVGRAGQCLDGILPVLCCVADVVFPGAGYIGEALLQRRDDLCGIVDRESCLGHTSKIGRASCRERV